MFVSHITPNGQSDMPSWFRASNGPQNQYLAWYECYCHTLFGRPLWQDSGPVLVMWKLKVKISLSTPWRNIPGEEV